MAGGWGSAQVNYQLGYQTKQGGLSAKEEARREYLISQITKLDSDRKRLNIEKVTAAAMITKAVVNAEASLRTAEAEFGKATALSLQAYADALKPWSQGYLEYTSDILSGETNGDYEPAGDFKEKASGNFTVLETGLGAMSGQANIVGPIKEVVNLHAAGLASEDPAVRTASENAIISGLRPYMDPAGGSAVWSDDNVNEIQDKLNQEAKTPAEQFRTAAYVRRETAEVVGRALTAIEERGNMPPGSLTNERVVASVSDMMLPESIPRITAGGSPEQVAQQDQVDKSRSELEDLQAKTEKVRVVFGPANRRAEKMLNGLYSGDADWLTEIGFGQLDPDEGRSEIEQGMYDEYNRLNEKAKTPDPLDAAVIRLSTVPGWDQYKRMYGFERDDEAAIWAARDPRGTSALTFVKGAQAAGMTDAEMRNSLRLGGYAAEERDVGHGFRSDMRAAAANRGATQDWNAAERQAKAVGRQGDRERTGPEDMSQNQRDRAAAKYARQRARNQPDVSDLTEHTEPTGEAGDRPLGSLLKENQGNVAERLAEKLGLEEKVAQMTDDDTSTISGIKLNPREKKREDKVADPGSAHT